MAKLGLFGRRTRGAASIAAAVLGSFALGCLAVPLLQQSVTESSATRLRDGTLAAPDLGALGDLPPGVGSQSADPPPVEVAGGVAARGEGARVRLTTLEGTAPVDSSVSVASDVLGLALAPTGTLLAVVDAAGSLSLFELGARAEADATTTTDLGTRMTQVATSGDGSFVAVAAAGGDSVQLFDRAGGTVGELDLGLAIADLASGPGSTMYALTDGAIVRLDASDARVVRAVAAPTEGAVGIALVGAGKLLSVWDQERLLLLESASLDTVSSYEPGAPVFDVADGSAEGTMMVGVGGTAPHIALVDLGSGATLSEISDDIPSPAAIGPAGSPASLLLATPRGAALGSWEASRVPWLAWWLSAAALALLAGACLAVALMAPRTRVVEPAPAVDSPEADSPDSEVADESDVDLDEWFALAIETPDLEPVRLETEERHALAVSASVRERRHAPPPLEPVALDAGRHPVALSTGIHDPVSPPSPEPEPLEPGSPEPSEPGAPEPVAPDPETRHPMAVSGSIHERMSALSFCVRAPAPAEHVVALVRADADRSGAAGTSFAVDGVFGGRTVSGSVLTHGVRMATFVVSLTPAPGGGTRSSFAVNWYRTSPPMVPFVPVDREESVSYGPLRDFAIALAETLEDAQP